MGATSYVLGCAMPAFEAFKGKRTKPEETE
jgi:hypothetical protein